MILKQDKLKQSLPELKGAIELFVWGLSNYDVLILKTEKNTIEFVIQKFSYRYKTNNQITGAIDWLKQQIPNVKIEIIPDNKSDIYVMGLRASKEKKEKIEIPIDEPELISSDEKTT
jgi:hypothetical protein